LQRRVDDLLTDAGADTHASSVHTPLKPFWFDLSNYSLHSLAMLDLQIKRIMDAYPTIYLACHRRHLRGDGEGKTVSQHQASILSHLHISRPQNLSKLAEHMGVSRSTMSINVGRLIAGGYVQSHPDGSDRRRIGLTLTRKGQTVKEQNTVLDPELLKVMVRSIPPADLEPALAGIECLAKYAGIMLNAGSSLDFDLTFLYGRSDTV
jgi:DNA-binding MarR family transcriptional regulator